jgi:uncharacterized membrane protein
MNWGLVAILLPVVYVSLDLLNFKVVARKLYASFYNKGVTNYYAAAAIYLLYPLAVVGLTSARDVRTAALKGATLGLTAYGMYHLTNMATMDKWPAGIALYDTLWGVLVTMTMATLVRWLKKSGPGGP